MTPPLSFASEVLGDARATIPSSPSSGDGLEAITWDDESVDQTLGTENAEYLAARAAIEDWMPERLGPAWRELAEGQKSASDIACTRSGIVVTVPALRPGERCQIQFNVAWARKTLIEGEHSMSSWFAVDASYKEVFARFL